jgi:hypothetical protein
LGITKSYTYFQVPAAAWHDGVGSDGWFVYWRADAYGKMLIANPARSAKAPIVFNTGKVRVL